MWIVDGQLLTIRAERTLSAKGDRKWLARERQSGSFLRQLNLGQGIDRAASPPARQWRADVMMP